MLYMAFIPPEQIGRTAGPKPSTLWDMGPRLRGDDTRACVDARRAGTVAALSRYVRRDREPSTIPTRPAVGIAAARGVAVGGRVAGAGMDDGEVAHQPDVDVVRLEIPDRHRDRGLLEEAGAVDQRLVGVGAIEIRRKDFVEMLHVGILYRIDVVAVKAGQFVEILAHRSVSVRSNDAAAESRSCCSPGRSKMLRPGS